jgi:uncharacterized protein YraI
MLFTGKKLMLSRSLTRLLAAFGLSALCVAAGLVLQSPALAVQGVNLTANATAGDDDVIATVYVGTSPGRWCHGSIRLDGWWAPLPKLKTDGAGGGRWRWQVADNVPSGTWQAKVKCQLPGGAVIRKTTFRASHGRPTGKSVRGLIAPGSMRAEPWHAKDVGHGIGGGGRDDGGYPFGQCTWWVRLKRPDIPVFPGPAGDAANWADSARRADPPFEVGKRAKPGAAVVFQPGQAGAGEHGHVAYVEAVRGPRMTISEANFPGTKPGHLRTLQWRGKGFEFIYEGEEKRRNPGPQPPNTLRYYVFRTCTNGACGLRQRSGPGTSFPLVGVPLPDGTAVDISCQTKGTRVVGLDASSTDVWDRLADGSFVSDYFVNTAGKRDQFTVPIPNCAQTTPLSGSAPETVSLTSPDNEAILTGTAQIGAVANTQAVRFEALYSATPGIRGSATWHLLGTDSSAANGFSLSWDTTAIPNQGLARQETIQIAAVAVSPSGTPTSARDVRQVAVANADPDDAFPHHVYNTCEIPQCELNRRSGPGFSEYPKVGATREGEEVRVVCQAHGQLVTGSEGASNIWDKFDDGSWGSDYYVDTPRVGEFSPPIPQCTSIPPPPALEVQLEAPSDGKTVTGNVEVKASGTGPAVRFEAFYSPTPQIAETAAWHSLGTDSSPGDGFTVPWETSAVPNQGLPVHNTVRVRAIALNYRGETTSLQSVRRVAVANPSQDGSYRYHVFGTCANDGDCEVELYAGPGYSAYPVVGSKAEDDEVDVVCQAHGETFTEKTSSDVWNELSNGAWITDYFVETPVPGAFSPPIPVCDEP